MNNVKKRSFSRKWFLHGITLGTITGIIIAVIIYLRKMNSQEIWPVFPFFIIPVLLIIFNPLGKSD